MSAPWGLIAGVGLLTMTACAAEVPAPGPTTVTSTTLETATSTSTSCEVDDGTAAALEPVLTDKLPAGYERAPDTAEDTGPTDLGLAAFLVGGPDEQAVLSGLGYRRGYRRLWYPPDGGGDDLIVHLYEFCDAEGAGAYLRHTRERLLSPLWGSVEVDADLPEDAVTLLQEGDSGGESFVAVLRVDGRFYVEIGAYGGPPREALETLLARAGGLSTAQVDKLP